MITGPSDLQDEKAAAKYASRAPVVLAIRYYPYPVARPVGLRVTPMVVLDRTGAQSEPQRIVIINAAAALVALSVFEAYLGCSKFKATALYGGPSPTTTPYPTTCWATPDEECRHTARNTTAYSLYDVVYTIGAT